MRVADLIGMEESKKRFNILYTYPTDEELEKVGVTGLFWSLHTLGRSIKCINRPSKWF